MKPGAPRKALLRVYGEGTESFFERETEHRIFAQFSEQGIGPKLYGYFDGGRIEEFLDARSLTSAEFPENLVAIGVKIAEMHRAEVDLPKRPSLFSNLYMWYDAAKSAAGSLDKAEDKELLKRIDLPSLEAEIASLQTLLSALQSPLTFCHNDLICGNMMKYADGRIIFIDYEYGSYNFRGYDFGNHFTEWTLDYTVKEWPKFRIVPSQYPSEEQQRTLFTSYLRRNKELAGETDTTPTDSELGALMDEAVRFSLAAHLLWSLWAIKQASTSEIEFGYMQYSVQRIEEYFRLKRQVYGEGGGGSSKEAH
jgi:choline/ethanolamine kinase